MRSSSSQTKPFDQGATSVKLQDGLPNPYDEGTVEFGNYELGRAYALRARPAFAPIPVAVTVARVAPARRSPAKAHSRA